MTDERFVRRPARGVKCVTVPEGKRVLNTHVAIEEHAWLKGEAKRLRTSITNVLRGMIRRAMGAQP